MIAKTGLNARRVAAIAGLGYVAGAAIESISILEAPALGSPAAEIRTLYADQALETVKAVAGAISLALYATFVAAVVAWARADRDLGPWPAVARIGGIGAALVALIGLIAGATLIGAGGLTDAAVEARFDLALRVRSASAIGVAAFMLAIGLIGLRSGALPGPLARGACALAAPLAIASLAAPTGAGALAVVATAAFALQAAWIFASSLWLALADGGSWIRFARRAAFLVLGLAAGLVGVALLAVPDATGEFFAWPLGPPALAAFAGGVYLGSAIAYALALRSPEGRVRGMVLAAAVLSVSVLAITLTHLDQFDLDRTQAWAWLALFSAFSLLTVGLFAAGRAEGDDALLVDWVRALLAVVCVVLGALALVLWIDPSALSGPSPYELSPLGGRFAGSWVALLAVLAGWAAARNRNAEARLSALALIALPAGALLGALRTASELDPAGAALAYVAALTSLIGVGIAVLTALRRPER